MPVCSSVITTGIHYLNNFRFSHILFNTIVQCVVGVPLEVTHGAKRVSAIYVTGIIAGRIEHSREHNGCSAAFSRMF